MKRIWWQIHWYSLQIAFTLAVNVIIDAVSFIPLCGDAMHCVSAKRNK